MSASAQFNAAAIGQRPVSEFTGLDGITRRVETSGLMPSFPSTDSLEKTAFKVVVGSWKRLNRAQSSTSDFEVNLSTYAPKQSVVTRVQLVDVDIPNTQLLIEDLWNRVYFDMGSRPSVDCRSFTLRYTSVCDNVTSSASVYLPLALDTIQTYTLLPAPNVVRIFTQHRAPFPIQNIAAAWEGLAAKGNGFFNIIGLGTFPILAAHVRDHSAKSFDIVSADLYAALSSLLSPVQLYLQASPLPGPSFLARVVSRALTTALNIRPTGAAGHHWQANITYSHAKDTFDLQIRVPFPCRLATEGPISEYMGFGSPCILDGLIIPPRARFQAGPSYAALQTGDPSKPDVLATWIQEAFNRFVWDAFSFQIVFPGLAAINITIPGGYMSLPTLAEVITDALVASTPLVTCTAVPCGLAFQTESGDIFTLDWTVDPVFDPSRVGYDRTNYPAAAAHYPTRPARHIPLLPSLCGPTCCAPVQYDLPPCTVQVTYREDTGQVVLQTRPFRSFDGVVTSTPGGFTLNAVTALYVPGLAVGSTVTLAFTSGGAYVQVPVVVTQVLTIYEYMIAPVDTADASSLAAVSGETLQAIPTGIAPLTLYLQRNNLSGDDCATALLNPRCPPADGSCGSGSDCHPVVHGCTIDPEVIGFDSVTYESCGDLLISPGTLEICQDSYILVCLAFAAGNAIPNVGDVYYPFTGGEHSQLVFAKVLRGTFLRSDFDRVFDHYFAGSGQNLGYIRVQILNPNGTPYQTHGHSLSVTLRFDARQSYVSFGAGSAVIAGNDSLSVVPLSRGTVIGR